MYNTSNKCLRGTDLDHQEGALLDRAVHEELDAPTPANDLEAEVTTIDEVIEIATEIESVIVDPEAL